MNLIHAARAAVLMGLPALPAYAATPIDIGSRLELFVDRHLVAVLDGDARLVLHEPHDAGKVMDYDLPWEGVHSIYTTVIHDGSKYRMYYRGLDTLVKDEDRKAPSVTCYAESEDGVHWTKPSLGLIEIGGSKDNNVVINEWPFAQGFSPFLDANPQAPADQRYKSLSGSAQVGLFAFVSPDGLTWRKLSEEPAIPWKEEDRGLDSQNVAFWSQHEQQYVAYFRMTPINPQNQRIRAIGRATSKDFIHWSQPKLMTYTDTDSPYPSDHLYTNQTSPYFRAPHIYLATAARFMPHRQAVTEAQAESLGLDMTPKYLLDTSDSVLMSSRGGGVYDRTFLAALIKPGIGAANWTSRSNYPALNIVPTGETEMSLYVNCHYGHSTAHLRRYTMRTDGLASVQTGYDGGELLTRPLVFDGAVLVLNYATSAAGGIRVEIQDAEGRPIPGFTLADCVEVIGNEIERAVTWKHGTDVSRLAGQPVRLRFEMKDADLYSLRFR